MLNIYEISEQFKIPLTKLRRLEKLGLLKTKPYERTVMESAIAVARHGKPLSARQLVQFTQMPERIKEAGDYARAIRAQVKALGDVAGEAMRGDLDSLLMLAAMSKDPGCIADIAKYIAGVIPAGGCGYAYIAVRLLHGVAPNMLDFAAGYVSRAIAMARRDPALAGMSATENGRTKFFQKSFDL